MRIILKIIKGKKETKLFQDTAVNLHSIFVMVNGYVFVRSYCRQLKLGVGVNKFSGNLNSMRKKINMKK